MRDIQSLFADYAAYHQTKGNKWFHRFGIPLIMLSGIGMLTRVPVWREITGAVVLIVIAEIVYFMLDWRFALLMLGVSALFYAAGAMIPFVVNVALFIIGWIFQFIGHSVYEHRSPAFLKNGLHLLVGPLWILNDAVPIVRPTSSSS